MRVFLILLFFVSISFSQGIVTAHYDIKKESVIYGVVYQQPIGEKLFWNGFVDVWHNPNEPTLTFPANKWVIQSKHWVSYSITQSLSASVEMNVMYNLADAWSYGNPFRQDKIYAFPKIGVQYRLW